MKNFLIIISFLIYHHGYSNNFENLSNFIRNPYSNDSIIDFKIEYQRIHKNELFDSINTIFKEGYEIIGSKKYLTYLETKYQYDVISVKSVSHKISLAFIFNFLGKCQYIFESFDFNDSIIQQDYSQIEYYINNPDSIPDKEYDNCSYIEYKRPNIFFSKLIKDNFQKGYTIVCDTWYMISSPNENHLIRIKSKNNGFLLIFVFKKDSTGIFELLDIRTSKNGCENCLFEDIDMP